jgi:hypothetical protein
MGDVASVTMEAHGSAHANRYPRVHLGHTDWEPPKALTGAVYTAKHLSIHKSNTNQGLHRSDVQPQCVLRFKISKLTHFAAHNLHLVTTNLQTAGCPAVFCTPPAAQHGP